MSIINNYETIMKWNCTYRLDEVLPHPNINIQIGQTYQSELLEAYPEVQIMIQKGSNQNLVQLSCENVTIFIRNNILPKIYTTYLSEDCDSGDEPLSQSEFLRLFKLKTISNSTVWKWMRHFGYCYDE